MKRNWVHHISEHILKSGKKLVWNGHKNRTISRVQTQIHILYVYIKHGSVG